MCPPFPDMPRLAVSWGEVFDKLSILKIKAARIGAPDQLVHIRRERSEIEMVVATLIHPPGALHALPAQLDLVNTRIWDIENGKRDAERRQVFDAAFIALAREVYKKNDERAAIKRAISILLGSALLEQKSHDPVTPAP